MLKKKPKKKEIKIKCLQGQMKEGEKEIDCSSYPRGMKHEVLSHYQGGYMRGLCIGVDKTHDEWQAYIIEAVEKIRHETLINLKKNSTGSALEMLDNLLSEIKGERRV